MIVCEIWHLFNRSWDLCTFQRCTSFTMMLRFRRCNFAVGPKNTAWTQLLDPEDGGDMFLRNVGWYSTDCTVLYPEDGTLHVIFWSLNQEIVWSQVSTQQWQVCFLKQGQFIEAVRDRL
jgi:hypothetical protein